MLRPYRHKLSHLFSNTNTHASASVTSALPVTTALLQQQSFSLPSVNTHACRYTARGMLSHSSSSFASSALSRSSSTCYRALSTPRFTTHTPLLYTHANTQLFAAPHLLSSRNTHHLHCLTKAATPLPSTTESLWAAVAGEGAADSDTVNTRAQQEDNTPSSTALDTDLTHTDSAAPQQHTAAPTHASAAAEDSSQALSASEEPSNTLAASTSTQTPPSTHTSAPTRMVVVGVDPDTHGGLAVASWLTHDLQEKVNISHVQWHLYDVPVAVVHLLTKTKDGKARSRRWLDIIAARKIILQIVQQFSEGQPPQTCAAQMQHGNSTDAAHSQHASSTDAALTSSQGVGATATEGVPESADALHEEALRVDMRAFVEAPPIMPHSCSPRTMSQQLYAVGVWYGLLSMAGFKTATVNVMQWKGDLGLKGLDKDDSRLLARRMVPSKMGVLERKKDHGRAEALLIAAWGMGCTRPTPNSSKKARKAASEAAAAAEIAAAEIESAAEVLSLAAAKTAAAVERDTAPTAAFCEEDGTNSPSDSSDLSSTASSESHTPTTSSSQSHTPPTPTILSPLTGRPLKVRNGRVQLRNVDGKRPWVPIEQVLGLAAPTASTSTSASFGVGSSSDGLSSGQSVSSSNSETAVPSHLSLPVSLGAVRSLTSTDGYGNPLPYAEFDVKHAIPEAQTKAALRKPRTSRQGRKSTAENEAAADATPSALNSSSQSSSGSEQQQQQHFVCGDSHILNVMGMMRGSYDEEDELIQGGGESVSGSAQQPKRRGRRKGSQQSSTDDVQAEASSEAHAPKQRGRRKRGQAGFLISSSAIGSSTSSESDGSSGGMVGESSVFVQVPPSSGSAWSAFQPLSALTQPQQQQSQQLQMQGRQGSAQLHAVSRLDSQALRGDVLKLSSSTQGMQPSHAQPYSTVSMNPFSQDQQQGESVHLSSDSVSGSEQQPPVLAASELDASSHTASDTILSASSQPQELDQSSSLASHDQDVVRQEGDFEAGSVKQ